ncbi:MAG: DUF2059 domain-containing protein [Deltaproteobacteria bacterium]|nr:DUF2059 domain-containing protein [Deltaproteobacteria bacterium]
MTKREKVHKLMILKGYVGCVEKRLSSLAPLFPYLETREGMKTPLRCGEEVNLEEIVERMVALYEQYWDETEIDEMLCFFKRPVGQKLIASGEQLVAKLCGVLDDYLWEKMTRAAREKMH